MTGKPSSPSPGLGPCSCIRTTSLIHGSRSARASRTEKPYACRYPNMGVWMSSGTLCSRAWALSLLQTRPAGIEGSVQGESGRRNTATMVRRSSLETEDGIAGIQRVSMNEALTRRATMPPAPCALRSTRIDMQEKRDPGDTPVALYCSHEPTLATCSASNSQWHHTLD
ncbi:hypothetical protein BV20DRAFT_229439 [Pilatotrama ljubarskyi]|nr:hypothetical protein BV20DRAFT_229439 [Pilatotrama ljubarskyi]